MCGSVFFACSRNVPHNYHIFKLPRAADSVGIFPLPLSAIKANCMRASRGALRESGGWGVRLTLACCLVVAAAALGRGDLYLIVVIMVIRKCADGQHLPSLA